MAGSVRGQSCFPVSSTRDQPASRTVVGNPVIDEYG